MVRGGGGWWHHSGNSILMEFGKWEKPSWWRVCLKTIMHSSGSSTDIIIKGFKKKKGFMWRFIYNLEIIINWSWTFGSPPRWNPLNVYLREDTERIQFSTCIFIYKWQFFFFFLYRVKVKICLRVKYKKKVIKVKIQDWDSAIYFPSGSLAQ